MLTKLKKLPARTSMNCTEALFWECLHGIRSFRYKVVSIQIWKSFRYTCKVVSIHIWIRFETHWSQFDATSVYLNYSFDSLKKLRCCFRSRCRLNNKPDRRVPKPPQPQHSNETRAIFIQSLLIENEEVNWVGPRNKDSWGSLFRNTTPLR